MTLTVGFIGFGEAGHAIAKGLAAQGVSTRAYDILMDEPKGRAAMEARGRDANTLMFDSPEAMLGPCDVVICAVFTANCVAAAESASAHLRAGQLYVDMNSVSPATKRAAQHLVERKSARYVDAGAMAAVPPRLHKVPMLLAGPAAAEAMERLAPYGMELEILGPNVGQAASAKMFQSILVKGTEALLLECLVAASESGIERLVLDSVTRATPGFDWAKRANYMLGRCAKHGSRRADEMDEVASTLDAMGIEPMVTRGAARRMRWAAERTHGRCSAEETPGYQEVIAVLRAAGNA
jgi:3-hydroxyisobutyrate dehydrogenase-like beta-hydroxyacid dehydrogenase